MGKRTVTVDEYKCNNPTCGTVVLASKDEPPDGFGGRIIGVNPNGGRAADWWACSEDCIQPAVLAALSED